MKKYLKTTAKKSVSLFLAVLMVLSCWVWVAPEKAEVDAANITLATQYEVEIQWTISKKAITGGDLGYTTLGDNGWGSESGTTMVLTSLSGMTAVGTYSKKWTTTAFPYSVTLNTNFGSSSDKSRTNIDFIKINGKTVYHGGEGWDGDNECKIYPNYSSSNLGTSGSTGQTYTWPRPMIAGFLDSEATNATPEINVTMNRLNGANVEKSTTFDITKYTCYDQYGVKIPDAAAYYNSGKVCSITGQKTYVADTNNSEDTTVFATDIWSKGDNDQTVVVSPNLQVSDPNKATKTFYLVREYTMDDGLGTAPKSRASSKITVTYPKYTVNFNSGLSHAKISYNGDGSPATGTYSPAMYNGGKIAVPTEATADGYTFKGFWSKSQPATGNASYNAAETVFATPCSTVDFNEYVKMPGAKVNGSIVTITENDVEKSYYDAGVALVPSEVETIDVSDNYSKFTENWYGWWIAKDLSVKFYDVDGTFLGSALVKAGQTQKDVSWPTSKYTSGYTSGAFKFNVNDNIWVNTDGTEYSTAGCTFSKDLILTPKLTRASYDGSYKVYFINPNSGGAITLTGTTGEYSYRANLADPANNFVSQATSKTAATPNDVFSALDYSYELIGWSSIKPTTGKNYHVLLEDADFDVNNTSIGVNKDWIVRGDATYYAVYRRHIKTYVVNFNFKDATGADVTRQLKFKYGGTLAAPIDYVPYTYVTKGFGYTFEEWSYTAANGGDATLGYDGEIAFTSDNIQIAPAALDGTGNVTPIEITAVYGEPVGTPYTVKFSYVDDKGADVSKSAEVRNEQFILQTTVDTLEPADEWENEDQLFSFLGQWEITEGSATVGKGGAKKKVGDKIFTADLAKLTPTSNITFKAVYGNPIPYYTVTYIDGANTFTDRVLKDSNVPEWTYKEKDENGVETEKVYVPADYEGEGGTYVFQGWYDEKQADADYKVTNGNKITTSDTVTANLTLYAQFKFIPFKYTIKFMNHDGSVQLGAGEFEKGQNIEAIATTATKAAQSRAADEVYSYVFLGWDKAVPTFCEGYDVTFTALYKPVYNYYNAMWYNSSAAETVDGVVTEWAADETAFITTTKHTYNSKLYAPSANGLTCPVAAPAGQNYVFAGWNYVIKDADGNVTVSGSYTRGMTITSEMIFFATYTLTAKTHTVTTVVKGESTDYTVADGNKVVISDPLAGYINEAKHDRFDGWYTDATYTTEFDADAAITTDITIYAKFTESNHEFTNKELVKAPTYYALGENKVWCECAPNKTTTESIPMLTDTVVPSGTIYLGEHSWSSAADAPFANETDGDPISIFVNANTSLIITSNDTGDKNALYNPSGIGMGVRVIRAFAFPAETVLTAQNYGAAQALAVDVYYNDTEDLTNNANFAIKLSDMIVADLDADGNVQYDEENNVKFKKLESGESYIIYYYVIDKAGNQLNRKVRTAKFLYDNDAPAFAVEGENDNATVPTYCGDAKVTGIEKDAVLTVNGNVVEATFAEGATTGTYEIKYAENLDNIIITATDKAGNTYTKKIKVSDHQYIIDEVLSSCTTDGYKKEICRICDYVKTNVTYTHTGHVMGIPAIVPATCTENGYEIVKCENCDLEVKNIFKADEQGNLTEEYLYPALEHTYAKVEGTDEIEYTTVTASTCKTEGLAEAFCSRCSEGRITKTLDLDPDNHEDITITKVEADCVNDGYYTEACSCGVTIKSETYKATGHGTIEEGTAAWYVTLEPTCYQKGSQELRCTICSNAIEENGAVVTEEIPATGEHVKVVTNPDTYKEDGFVYYHCATEGCDHKFEPKAYVDDSLKEFTVTFKAEDGTVIKTFTQLEGTAIAKDAVTAPDKANSADGKFKYTFAGWTDGEKTYKLPLTVTGNLELKASYKEVKIMYTHQFIVPTTWTVTTATENNTEVFAELVGGIGDVRVPSSEPAFKSTDADAGYYTYKFEGWKNAETGAIVKDFTVAGDATFIAVFRITAKTYSVIYYNGTELVWNTTVNAGQPVSFGGTAPTKTFDETYHYTFSGKWYTDATLKTEYTGGAITAETRLYAGFTAEEHKDYVVNTKVGTVVDEAAPEVKDGIVQKADCLLPELTEFICACGHTKTEQTDDKLGHKMSEHTYDEESGKMVSECERCDYTESYKASVTINFVDDAGLTLQLTTVKKGEKVTYDFDTSGIPTKAADKEYTYTFAGFEDEEGNDVYTYEAGKAAEFIADEDAEYKAFFTATARTFTVKYTVKIENIVLDDDTDYEISIDENGVKYVILEKYTGLNYNDEIPAFTGDTKIIVVPGFEQHGHKVFAGWNITADAKVTNDISITPKFRTEEHECVEIGQTAATCTDKGGIKYQCTGCAYAYVDTDANLPALGHAWDEGTVTLEPDYKTQTDGILTKTCSRCGDTKDEAISGKARSIKVTVTNADGAAVEGAKVSLFNANGEQVGIAQLTDNKGVTIFTGLADGKYSVSVVYPDGKVINFSDIEVNEDGSVKNGDIVSAPEKEEVDTSCKCTCHKDTFWGIIFRLFQKIIKIFTGKATCCACPDARI